VIRKLSYRIPRPRLLSRGHAGYEASPLGAPISHSTRVFVWKRDVGKCRYCGSRKELQFDHVIPRSMGGSGEPGNVELLCRACNLRKRATLTAI
jgi:5-methylcytosine-specific restriction endonuclease McrA